MPVSRSAKNKVRGGNTQKKPPKKPPKMPKGMY